MTSNFLKTCEATRVAGTEAAPSQQVSANVLEWKHRHDQHHTVLEGHDAPFQYETRYSNTSINKQCLIALVGLEIMRDVPLPFNQVLHMLVAMLFVCCRPFA